jgi:hypothetical protein
MASGTKNRTTMAKLNRERKLRERRLDKQASSRSKHVVLALTPEVNASRNRCPASLVVPGR